MVKNLNFLALFSSKCPAASVTEVLAAIRHEPSLSSGVIMTFIPLTGTPLSVTVPVTSGVWVIKCGIGAQPEHSIKYVPKLKYHMMLPRQVLLCHQSFSRSTARLRRKGRVVPRESNRLRILTSTHEVFGIERRAIRHHKVQDSAGSHEFENPGDESISGNLDHFFYSPERQEAACDDLDR